MSRTLDQQNRLAREQELIETALAIMEQEGTAGLTMDKVVVRVPYSKGTVYNHFSSREDLLTGVCNAGMAQLADLFSRALTFGGSARERLMAIHYAYLLHALLDPTKFMLVISAKTANLMERTSEQRLEQHYELEGRLLTPMLELVDLARRAGDLELAPDFTPQQAVFTNWAGSFGVLALLISGKNNCSGRRGLDIQEEVFNHIDLLLDGMKWRPLSTEFDYRKTLARIRRELFAGEAARIAGSSAEQQSVAETD